MIDHDLHVHTTLSDCCHDENAVPEAILRRAAEVGLKTIGFADHLWDSAVAGASDWYAPQDLDHILQIRERIPDDTFGVRVLVGCETEFLGGRHVGISPDAAAKLDFVLVPTTHFHMKGFVVPESLQASKDVAAKMVERFKEAVALEVTTGIAHPFMPLGVGDRLGEILDCISDAAFEDCFGAAADRGVSIEVHHGMARDSGDGPFLRILSIARQAGCVFHFASDAHSLQGIGEVHQLEPLARAAGITAEDVLPLARAV
jgi:histidinol phosphatase-like PHP family hydrolase